MSLKLVRQVSGQPSFGQLYERWEIQHQCDNGAIRKNEKRKNQVKSGVNHQDFYRNFRSNL